MDIEELREAVEEAGPRAPGRRFSAELRAELVRASHRLWDAGVTVVDIAEALGVHAATVTRYLDEEVHDEEPEERPELPHAGLVPVSITESVLASAPTRLTTPSGFVVEGLDVPGVVALIRALR